MSALDQAIIKAYAKDRPAAAPSPVAQPKPRLLTPAARLTSARLTSAHTTSARAVDQLYHDGTLYRVEAHAAASRASQGVPTPHLSLLPPTSPRRGVRRSMLRMLAAGTDHPAEAVAEPPPRVARKVIIRHISHSAAPPPLGLLRPTKATDDDSRSELPPETISNEPTPTSPANPLPASPQVAPLNFAIDNIRPIEVRGDWEHETAVSPMVLVAEVHPNDAPAMWVSAQLDALAAAEAATIDQAQAGLSSDDSAPASFAAKSLEDNEEPRIQFRVDAPHAHGRHRPHARFAKPPADESLAPLETIAAEEEAALDAVVEGEPTAADELTFADAPAEVLAEALASDLIPAGNAAAALPEGASLLASATSPAKPAVPLWEVDHFHWPRTCEKLFADEHGYLSRAGDKLQAAMQDGLKVLAVTGSRRGEGRSTLALCLARAAAQVGIQAAVMDADFARPQLASKIGVEIAFGWQEAALGRIPLSEAAVKSLADNITLLPLESSAATRALSLADPRVTATIRAAAATFELLILDLGPLGAGAEIAFPHSEGCPFDAAIVVRDLRFATAAESEAIGHALQDAGIEAVGIAENFVIEDEIPATSV